MATVLGDNILEEDEVFTVALSSLDDSVVFGISMVNVTIINDDGKLLLEPAVIHNL